MLAEGDFLEEEGDDEGAEHEGEGEMEEGLHGESKPIAHSEDELMVKDGAFRAELDELGMDGRLGLG